MSRMIEYRADLPLVIFYENQSFLSVWSDGDIDAYVEGRRDDMDAYIEGMRDEPILREDDSEDMGGEAT
jgi:hypothetical protein